MEKNFHELTHLEIPFDFSFEILQKRNAVLVSGTVPHSFQHQIKIDMGQVCGPLPRVLATEKGTPPTLQPHLPAGRSCPQE